jgi:hypothetical protein
MEDALSRDRPSTPPTVAEAEWCPSIRPFARNAILHFPQGRFWITVAVGTTIADRPPHRSVQARLRIRLLSWMSGGKAGIRIGMQNTGLRNPPESPRVSGGNKAGTTVTVNRWKTGICGKICCASKPRPEFEWICSGCTTRSHPFFLEFITTPKPWQSAVGRRSTAATTLDGSRAQK